MDARQDGQGGPAQPALYDSTDVAARLGRLQVPTEALRAVQALLDDVRQRFEARLDALEKRLNDQVQTGEKLAATVQTLEKENTTLRTVLEEAQRGRLSPSKLGAPAAGSDTSGFVSASKMLEAARLKAASPTSPSPPSPPSPSHPQQLSTSKTASDEMAKQMQEEEVKAATRIQAIRRGQVARRQAGPAPKSQAAAAVRGQQPAAKRQLRQVAVPQSSLLFGQARRQTGLGSRQLLSVGTKSNPGSNASLRGSAEQADDDAQQNDAAAKIQAIRRGQLTRREYDKKGTFGCKLGVPSGPARSRNESPPRGGCAASKAKAKAALQLEPPKHGASLLPGRPNDGADVLAGERRESTAKLDAEVENAAHGKDDNSRRKPLKRARSSYEERHSIDACTAPKLEFMQEKYEAEMKLKEERKRLASEGYSEVLLEMAEKGDEDFCMEILAEACQQTINAVDAMGRTVLHMAAKNDMALFVVAALDHPQFRHADKKHRGGWTALHVAARAGQVEVVEELLKHPRFTALNATDGDGRTALHCAAVAGDANCISAIMRHPAFTCVDARNNSGFTALHVAERYGHEAACWELFEGSAMATGDPELQERMKAILEEKKKAQALDRFARKSLRLQQSGSKLEGGLSETQEEVQERKARSAIAAPPKRASYNLGLELLQYEKRRSDSGSGSLLCVTPMATDDLRLPPL
eukprot:TRINITY_DN11446_c0_g2_i4.p1 TRINITY_DN11446_c0_g2~~TRINITY_DN11446_c0_g2_i4.p1  ORF type:complete len:696 (+),score=201.09 TRINITY_DN11446_c0_g2_i4:143-2230(+)